VLRANLLRSLHVREFSSEAVFLEPCRTHVLHDVICTYCLDCRDLDLCRDEQLQARLAL
jgi:DNA polymerase epsilon subunit 1